MNLEQHIQIATEAYSRGFLDADGLVRAVKAIANADQSPTVEQAWVESGRLTPAQLAVVMQAAQLSGTMGTQDTLLTFSFAEGTDSIVDQPVVTDKRYPPEPQTRVASKRARRSTVDGLAPPPEPKPASTQVARYRRVGILGEGGLGEVVECYDNVLGRSVALKSTRTALASDPATHAVLEREARIVAGLEHPNIIPVYDAGHHAGAGPYYVMQQVHQPSLDAVLEQLYRGAPQALAEFTLKRMLRYFVQICRAVDYAHSRGVIHCDLKPANVLLGEFGEVLVVDWGLAHSEAFPAGPRGGTPGYMAPEQFDDDVSRYDARTDVFALGVILYRILTLKHPFPQLAKPDQRTSKSSAPLSPYERPVPPSERAPDREVPPEVEEICERAMAIHRDERFSSARALADAIEEYLEGTKERERRQREADKQADMGDDMAERFHEFDESRPEQLAQLEELRSEVPPWAGADDKQDIWHAEDALAITDALRVRTMHAAVTAYEQALEAVPHHKRARAGLARLYYAELLRARRVSSELDELHFEQLVRHYDDGTLGQELSSDGEVEIDAAPGAELWLVTLREVGRRMIEGGQEPIEVGASGDGGVATIELAPGSYVIEARTSGHTVRHPVLVRPGSHQRVRVDAAAAATLSKDEVLIPGGVALLGGTGPMDSGEPREVDVPTFAIARRPITFGEYMAFIDAIRGKRGQDAFKYTPRSRAGAPYDITAERRDVPVFGVSANAARAYAAWLSGVTGIAYRLPTDDEWEKAARGTDGRAYPWGHHFDPSFCKMRHSRPGHSEPEPAGAFDADLSPYGVVDMAGSIANWTTGPGDVVYSRGGAWSDWPIDCRVVTRRRYLPDEHTERVGFRLARSIA